MRLSKLLRSIENGRMIYKGREESDWEREIIALSADSRKMGKSTLFFCLNGGKVDSHEYAQEAIANGAVAIVTERELSVPVPQLVVEDSREALGVAASIFYGEPTKDMTVIGVTGTNGKTTTSYLLQSVLESWGKNTGIIGTLGIRYGDVFLPSDLTTPDPIRLHKIFADMRSRGIEFVVMEVSAHALYYKKTVGVTFSRCIFSNFTQDHLDFFQTMQAYKEAKLRLFSSKICPVAIVNGDERVGREIGKLREKEGAKTIFYGLNTPTDAFAIITEESLYGAECIFNLSDELCTARLSLSGRHNVYNALSAAACAFSLGVDADTIARGLSTVKRVKGRLERIAEYRNADIYVDFAHTPDGLDKSLQALKIHCKGRLLCLFGCGGNRDKDKRAIMGEIAAKNSSFCVLTSDNPRFEDPLDIISAIEGGFRRVSTRYVIVPDRERAIGYAIDLLQEGDVLLIAGKGGEEYQEIMGIKYPFNDQDRVVEYLQRKGR